MMRTGGKAPSQRQLRVGEELRHALAEVLSRGELRDPALSDVSITVSEVRASPDLRNATAFVMPLGGADTAEVLAALSRAAPFLRGRVARMVRLRHTPAFRFEADTTYDEASRIDALLRDAAPTKFDDAKFDDAKFDDAKFDDAKFNDDGA